MWVGAQPAIFLFQFLFQGPQFVVLKQDESDGKGLPWVAVFVPYSGPLEFFDPFGESPETYKNYFKYWLESIGSRNERRCQSYCTTTCGEFCVYYRVKRLTGETMREIVQSFDTRNLYLNEILVHDFVCKLS